MKILFLLFHGFSEHCGISKKVRAQIDGLKENGHDVTKCYYMVESDGRRVWMLNNTLLKDYGIGIWGKIRHRISYDTILKTIIDNKIEFVYIRSIHNANPFTIHFIHQLKQKGIKVVMEIPTYPYDSEYRGLALKYKLELIVDKMFRKKLVKLLDGVVTFSNYKTIFGGKAINISNGIDFKKIKIKTNLNDTSKQLHLIAVAEVHYWHGFDRLIKGLADYYKKQQNYKVYFHLVGGLGPIEEKEYEQLITENNLEEYITLHGLMFGKTLDSMFEIADMGIGSLARHRSNITNIKTLKNREYAARGIPFIYSEIDDDFEQMPYILKAFADESAIDINEIIKFYHNCDRTPTKIRESITHLSWKEQMRLVVESI